MSAEHGEVCIRHRPECRHLSAGRPLAIRAVAVRDEGRLGIEPVRHSAANTVTVVLLVHVIPPFTKDQLSRWLSSASRERGMCVLRGT